MTDPARHLRRIPACLDERDSWPAETTNTATTSASEEDCPRFPCSVYKEGYVRGYADGCGWTGTMAGMADGFAEGYAAGHCC